MKYFLASSHCQSGTPMLRRDNDFCIMLKDALGTAPLKMLIVASDPEDTEQNDTFVKWEQDRFEKDGYAVEFCEILDSRTARNAEAMIKNSNFIMLYGGHLPTQNRFFSKINLKKLLKGFDGVILGISAGSMNCAGTVYVTPEMPGEAVDPSLRRFMPGLGITDINIVPHYNMVKNDILDGMRLFRDIIYPDSHGRQFIVIPDGSFVYGDGTTERLCGEGFMLADGVMTPVKDTGITQGLKQRKTTIGLYASVHNPDILAQRGWNENEIRQIFTDFAPDIICGEVRPEDYSRNSGYRGPGEYKRFIFDLCDKQGITFIPCDSFDELTLSVSEDFDETAPRWTDIMDRYMAAGFESRLPFNSDKYNNIVKEKQAYQKRMCPDAHRILWERRNRHITENILKAAEENPGKRILVVFGAEHTYWLKEEIEKHNNIKIVFPMI